MTLVRDDVAVRRVGALRRAVLASGLLACAASPALAGPARVQGEGIASFYGRSEHGGPTASGERFNMHAMTAAHRTAPLGSRLKVTNLRNGKSVVVRINDRGPFIRGRIIDLSHAAADSLGFVGAGLTRVAIETTEAGSEDAATRVATASEPEATGSTPAQGKSRRITVAAAEIKPILSDADRLMIARTAIDGR